jgi:carboxyl-terminal processing protease
MRNKERPMVYIPLVILLCSLAAGLLGPGLSNVFAAGPSEDDDIKASLKTFTKVYDVVRGNFAEPLNADKAIYKGAIQGMLRTLDPHSSFFDPRDFQVLREDQRGHYFGVGMMVSERNRRVIVVAPFAGSPAYKAGIRPGDTILQVNEKRTENLNVSEVADLLKGPRGTKVRVMVSREGADKPIVFDIVRDEIPRKSVQDAFWVAPGIAHLRVDSFNETTSRDVDENLRKLGEHSIRGLVLDLRENPGGLLNEGVAVAERFLQRNQSIVSHRGRASAEKPYVARQSGNTSYPIVVLVNRYSASASEIVAGALQDHDRAWILGENTFGKGLVQTVFPMSDNTGLALTTAKYYTPSGRLIQRDYANSSLIDYYTGGKNDSRNPLDAKMTDSGRTVYGGNGIAPDEKFVAQKLNRFQTDVKYRKYAFFAFASKYFGSHDTKLPKGWEPDQGIINDFRQFLLKEGVEFTEGEFAEHLPWIKQELKREFLVTAFGQEDSRRYVVQTDPMVARAIEVMPKAKELLDNAKKMIVQRSTKPTRQ